MRYVLSALAIAVILNCVISLIMLRPAKKVYALLVDIANNDEYPISCYETSIGRSRSCDIVFSNTTVSRSHAVVALKKDGFYVFDTESKAGVYVNGEKIEGGRQLADGDIISFGTSAMKFYIGSDAASDMSEKGIIKKAPHLVNIMDNSEYLLEGDRAVIGRQAGSNIEINARYVSRKQAELMLFGNKWYIEDFGNITRTTLNGDPIEGTQPISDGDVIKIGEYAFLYEE